MSEHNYYGYRLSIRGRAAAIALGAAALAVGGVLLVLGVTLLLGVLVAGTVLGAGMLAYRRLTGRHRRTPLDSSPGRGLDPALEVFPDDSASRRLGDKPPA
jgi:membrane protein implicated in regulation of membrane protease activity